MQGFWVTANFTEATVRNVALTDNAAQLQGTFVDFWSKNLLPYGEPEGTISQVSITNNTIELDNSATAIQIKTFFKLVARQQPSQVRFSGNVCRSYATVRDTVLALIVVSGDQRLAADAIDISNNLCSGLSGGLVVYFNGDATSATTRNVSRVKFANNQLGYLLPVSPGGLALRDVYLYGPAQGVVEELTVYGLQHPEDPLVTDGHAGGRATVKGRALVPVPVTWQGLTVGDGVASKKIAIDTDIGVACVHAAFTAGASSVAAGPIYPQFTGLVADSEGTAAASHITATAATALPARVYKGASWVSLFGATGLNFGIAEFTTSSHLAVQADFPCRSASI